MKESENIRNQEKPFKEERKLAAIMFTDIVGYTALMSKDERGARKLLQKQRDILKPLIKQLNGEWLKELGDGTLSSFDSAVKAVNCAIEIQRALKDDPDLKLRIGIHIGDVVFEGGDVFGHGVNVASRIQPLAEPGGICISKHVRDKIKSFPDIKTASLGLKELKNVEEPLEVYKVLTEEIVSSKLERKDLKPSAVAPIKKPLSAAAPRRRLLKRLLIPGSIVAVIVVLILIFTPWKIEFRSQEAVAAENRLAIMYFDNLVDPEDRQKLGEIATDLLITDLTESQYLQVVSSQRLYDILKLVGREGEKRIDRNVATEVAKKAGSRWMLRGSILQVEPQMVITSQLIDVETGNAVASQQITGETGEEIFSLVDKLTVEIKKDLSLPTAAQQEKDPQIADVTTHSPEAYRYYLEGVDYGFKYYFTEAEKSLEKALEYDSTFAMAYYRLAGLKSGEEQKKLTAKAVKYSDKVSQKEKTLIKGFEAYVSRNYTQAIKELQKIVERYPEEKEALWTIGYIYDEMLRQYEEAVRYYNKAIEIDPLYKIAYNSLAYVYDQIGDFDKSIWAINKYISLVPDEANPYDSRADLYAYNGKIDQAIESYKKALEIKPDLDFSLAKLGHMYLFKREYAKSESYYQELCSGSEKYTRSEGRTYLALIPIYQGKLETALKVLDDGVAADRMEQYEGLWNAHKHRLKSLVYEEKGAIDLALEEAQLCDEVIRKAYSGNPSVMGGIYLYFLAVSGKIAKAEELAQDLKKTIEEKDPQMMYVFWEALGNIELAKGNKADAVRYTEKAFNEAPYPYFHLSSVLAEHYLEADNLGEAVAEFEHALLRYDDSRSLCPIRAVKAYYLLGLAYEKSGWNDKAIEQYEEFLEIWKDADPDISEVEDAKQRLANLKSTS